MKKKIFLLGIILSGMILLVGCEEQKGAGISDVALTNKEVSNGNEETGKEIQEERKEDETTKVSAQVKENDYEEEEEDEEKTELEKLGDTIKEKYKKIFEESNKNYKIQTKYKEEDPDEYDIYIKEEEQIAKVHLFERRRENPINQSISYDKGIIVSFDGKVRNDKIKKTIIATIQAINPGMEQEEARGYMEELANSCTEEGKSKLIETDCGKIYFEYSRNGFYSLNIVFQENIDFHLTVPEKQEMYQEYTIEELNSVLNKGELVKIDGIIEQIEELDSIYGVAFVDTGTDNIRIEFDFFAYPDTLEVGKEYTFYGLNVRTDEEEKYIYLHAAVEK